MYGVLPHQPPWAVLYIALSPLATLHKLGCIMVWIVVLSCYFHNRRTRVVLIAVVPVAARSFSGWHDGGQDLAGSGGWFGFWTKDGDLAGVAGPV